MSRILALLPAHFEDDERCGNRDPDENGDFLSEDVAGVARYLIAIGKRSDEGKGAVGRDKQQSLEDRKASPLPFRRFVLHDRPSEKMGNNPFYFHHSIVMKCLGMCCVIVSGKS